MAIFSPKSLSQTYNDMKTSILALAPLTSSELGEVIDDIIFAIASELNDARQEMVNALNLLTLESTTGVDLDNAGAEYPNLKPRFSATKSTGIAQVTDPAVTKKSTTIDVGGANVSNTFINVLSTTGFPTSGTLLVGDRTASNFETVTYTGKTSTQFTPTSPLAFSHASTEPVTLVSVGDRVFPGPFTVSTLATAQTTSKQYSSTTPLIIYNGEEEGSMDIEASVFGLDGNTPSGTIQIFIGVPPFPGAVVTNGSALNNAIAKETDQDFRQRIRRERQALSSANIDAVYSALLSFVYQGQKIVFSQLVEDTNPSLPAIIYIDDGAAFTPSQATISSSIILTNSALGGEDVFFIPAENRPVVTLISENTTRIFANITVKKNNVVITQGDLSAQYRVQPDNGVIKLNTALTAGDKLEISALTYYTGLFQEANNIAYGKREDRVNYPGAVGLGQWVQLRTPAVQFISISGTIKLDGTRTKSDVITEMQQNFVEYINNLGIGSTVVRNRIIELGFVSGVRDFNLTTPASDIIITNGVLARTTLGNISVG